MTDVANALHAHFENVCRSELERLRKKTSALSLTDRSRVSDISREVITAIAAKAADALDRVQEPKLAAAVVRLFGVDVESPFIVD